MRSQKGFERQCDGQTAALITDQLVVAVIGRRPAKLNVHLDSSPVAGPAAGISRFPRPATISNEGPCGRIAMHRFIGQAKCKPAVTHRNIDGHLTLIRGPTRPCGRAYLPVPFDGAGRGDECCGGGSGIARNRTGADFQWNGAGGNGTTQGVNMLLPSALLISKMMPGRASSRHSCHRSIEIHSPMSRPFIATKRSCYCRRHAGNAQPLYMPDAVDFQGAEDSVMKIVVQMEEAVHRGRGRLVLHHLCQGQHV
jgi:hypothetical protein